MYRGDDDKDDIVRTVAYRNYVNLCGEHWGDMENAGKVAAFRRSMVS